MDGLVGPLQIGEDQIFLAGEVPVEGGPGTYGATLDELVDAPATGDPRINMRPLPTSDGSVVLPLTRRPGGIQAYKFVLPAGRDDVEPDLRTSNYRE